MVSNRRRRIRHHATDAHKTAPAYNESYVCADEKTGRCQEYRSSMILDSETSLVYLPDDIAEYIASLFVPPATYNTYSGIYTVPCTALAPRVGIITGGTSYFMSEDELMGGKGQGGGGVYCCGTRGEGGQFGVGG